MPRHYHPNPRDTTEGAKRIELAWLKKHTYLGGYFGGTLNWSSNGESVGNINIRIDTRENPNIEFDYKTKKHSEEEWRDIKYSFPMTSIPCRYGGKKWFFTCSLYRNKVYCGKRVRNLYKAGDYFGCRTCANLSYESCNESKKYKGLFKLLMQDSKAEEYYIKNVKRQFYRGKATKKYKRYLKIGEGYSERDVLLMEKEILAVNNSRKINTSKGILE